MDGEIAGLSHRIRESRSVQRSGISAFGIQIHRVFHLALAFMILFLYLFGISLFSIKMGNSPILVSDMFLVIGVIVCIVFQRKLLIDRLVIMGSMWWLVAVMCALVLSLRGVGHFDIDRFSLTIMRASLDLAVLSTLYPLLEHIDLSRVAKGLTWVIRTHAGVVLLFAVVTMTSDYSLVRIANVREYGDGLLFQDRRISGLFAEPAWFCWYISLCVFAITAINKQLRHVKLTEMDYLLIATSALVTTSVSGTMLATVSLLVHHFSVNEMRLKSILRICVAFGVLLLVSGLTLKSSFVDEGPVAYFLERAMALIAFTDGSALDRALGSTEVLLRSLGEVPLTGAGLGNESNFVQGISNDLIWKADRNFDLHISIFTAIVSTGILGGAIYLSMLVWLAREKGSRILGVGLLLTGIFWGGYVLGTIWWFFALGGLLKRKFFLRENELKRI